MSLPKNLLRAMCSAAEESPAFCPLWATVHEQDSINHLNATLQSQILFLRVRYEFNPLALGDWVSTKSWYRVSVPITSEGRQSRELEELRPLNSWVLKDPVGIIPSVDEITEETEWKNSVSASLFGKYLSWHVDDVHSSYVRQACAEVLACERLLIEWKRYGSVYEQEGWMFCSTEERKKFCLAVKRQRINVLEAKKKFELFRKNHAPKRLVSQAAGANLLEKRLLEKMQEVLMLN